MRHSWVLIGVALLLTSCGLSFSDTAAEQEPMLLPDYTDITLPVNIAPLNFSVEGGRPISSRQTAPRCVSR